MRPAALFALVLTALSLLAPAAPAAAQQQIGSCRVQEGTRRAVSRTVSGSTVMYVSRPRLACEGGIRIRADSMVSFESTGYNQLIGSVFFEDETRRLISRNARYFDQVGRLEADGDVELTDKRSGNVVEGQNLLYLRETQARPTEELTVWGGRAHALLYTGRASTEPDAPPDPERKPYDVTADRIFLRGEEYFQASGSVDVVRDSLDASADTLKFDQQTERLFLSVDAVVDQESYDLTGDEILIRIPGDTVRSVDARGGARVLGDDLDLTAPHIRMGLTGGALEFLWATPLHPGQQLEMVVGLKVLPAELDPSQQLRPIANSTDFRMEADSIEVKAPGEVLDHVFAVGQAHAVSTARDSLNTPDTPEIIRDDWIRGDTVVAFFEESPPGEASDSTAGYRLRRLEARGEAASLYRLEPDSARAASDSVGASGATAPVQPVPTAEQEQEAPPEEGEVEVVRRGLEPAVHYVTAGEIVIVFLEGQVERMEVRALEQGVHLDPIRGGVRASSAEGGGGR